MNVNKVRLTGFQLGSDLIKLLFNKWIFRAIIGTIIFKFIIYCPDVRSAFEKKEVGASSFAMGNAAVAIHDYLFAIYYNPAALLPSDKVQSAFTVQNFYGISNLNSVDLTTRFSVAHYPFSIAVNRFGDQKYHELQLSFGSRIEIIKNCAIGFSIQCYILSIKNYGQTLAWGANIAVLYKLLPAITVGGLVTNINRPILADIKEELPRTTSLGFCYLPAENLVLSFEIFHDIRYQAEIRFGCAYQVLPGLKIRAGIEDQLDIYSYGIGVNISCINIDYALRTHSVLGISHIATVSLVL
jgi:hypothetical protein